MENTMRKIFTMSDKELKVYDLIQKITEGMKQMKAAELLGVSERHFRRLLKAYREQGLEGLISKKRGKPSNNRLKEKVKKKIIERLKTKYTECGPTFACGKLNKEGIKVSSETVRKIMMEESLWEPRKRRRLTVHQRRDRREHKGELVQLDGSTHAWFEERAPKCCLIAYIDDATSEIGWLKFVDVESSVNYFITMKEYLLKHGKPLSFYADRLSIFRVNNDKEGYRKKGLTQLGRALKEIGVELICANSPQAKGRVERLFGTLQDRLVKELRLRGIRSIEKANRYLEKYIEEHNQLFAVTPAKQKDLHHPITAEELEKSFCFKEERTLTKNLELSYEGRIFQIEASDLSHRLIGAKAVVREDLDGEIEIEYEGKELAFKELFVKDHQGRIVNKREILLSKAV